MLPWTWADRDQVLELLRRLGSVRQVVTEEGAVQSRSPELCGRRNGLHMHRAGLRKAYKEVLLQG